MRILIADDSVATAETLRSLFPALAEATARTSSGTDLTIACASAQGKDCGPEDCACPAFDLHDQREFEATILDTLGMALLNRGCLEEGGALIKRAREIRRDFFGSEHPAYAISQNSFSRLRRERGDYKEAEMAARDALRINSETFGLKSLAVATSLYHLGAVQLDQGRFEDAEHTAIKGLGIMCTLGPAANDPNNTRLLEIRGRAELYLGKAAKAAATYTELLELDLEELGTREHYKYATHMGNFGMVKEVQGHKDQAERAYRDAIEFFVERFKNPCHPNLIDFYANLGSLLRERGTGEAVREAGDLFSKAVRLAEQVRGEKHVLVANDYANLGRWQYDSRDTKGAIATLGRALDIYEQNVKEAELPAEHFFLAEARTWKGRVLVESNSREAASEAEPLLELAVTHWPAQLGPGSVGEGMAKACLGHGLFLQDKELARSCKLLCEGYAIVKEKSRDAAFVARVKGWVEQQGCRCDGC
jgi:tetratricopeptide (TPR) repeat protein